MNEKQNTLSTILFELCNCVNPIIEVLDNESSYLNFLNFLGWDIDEVSSIPTPFISLRNSAETLVTLCDNLALEQEIDLKDFISLKDGFNNFYNSLLNCKNVMFYSNETLQIEIEELLPRQILDYLLGSYLNEKYPFLYSLIGVLGILRVNYVSEKAGRVNFRETKFLWEVIPNLFVNPKEVLVNTFNWNSPNFKYSNLTHHLENLLYQLGVDVNIKYLDKDITKLLTGDVNSTEYFESRVVNFPLFQHQNSLTYTTAGIGISYLPGFESTNPGLFLLPYIHGEIDNNFQISDNLKFSISGSLDLSNGIGVSFYPNKLPFIISGLNEPDFALQTNGNALFSLKWKNSNLENIEVFKLENGTVFDIEAISFDGGIEKDINDHFDIFGELLFENCRLLIKSDEGFLSKVFSDKGLDLSFDGGFGVSLKKSFYLVGGDFRVLIQKHIKFGFIEFKAISLNLKPESSSIEFNIGANIEINFGTSIKLLIENAGIKTGIDFNSQTKNIGLANLEIGFKPPNGVGLNIDTNAVKGGGYLYINIEEGRYAGVAGLSIKDKIKLSAFGLINTKFPDGRKGYSFLIFVSAEFSPVQLGFGFTLSGVGGLVGIHRSVNIDRLREGVKTKAYDRLLFPENPVENALEIIADLEAIFPVSEGRYVFGIMGKIGWGSPTLITIDLGLIIEVPNPVKLAILGVVKAILPDEQEAVLKLQVNFLGVIDFGKKQLSFDATIYDSRLLTFSLAGDMAMRLSWGSNSNFLMSVGGFHPSYQPPPQLISMKRLSLNLLGGDNPRLTLTTYFAVTSNTVQFGAKVELYVKVASKLTAEGAFGFDALFQFNPFYMKILAAAYVAIKWNNKEKFSISLSAALEGPKPWNVDGVAEIKVFFIKYKVQVQKTWGQPQDAPPPTVSVTDKLVAALDDLKNWSSELTPGKQQLVTLRKIDLTNESIMLPEGVLVISQKVLPMNINIQLFGTQEVSDGGQFKIDDVTITQNTTTSTITKTYVKEDFVPAHFRKMSETEKLSGPSFQKYDGGIRLDGMNELKGSDIKSKEIEYELIISVPEPPLEDQDPVIPPVPIEKPKIKEMVEVHQAMVKGSKAGQSGLSASKNIAPLAPKPITVNEEEYGVVKISDLTLVDSSALCASFTEAQDYYLTKVVEDIAWKNKLKIIPKFEIQTA